MAEPEVHAAHSDVTRRNFLKSSAAAGAGVWLASQTLWAQETPENTDELRVAMIGVGRQGRVLLRDSLAIPGVRFVAICDIWPYHLYYAANILGKFGHDVNTYVDYQEMLAREEDLDALIVATPDWMHAEHAIAGLEAGLDVYCEKEMSNDLAKARDMVLAARKTGKLLQIGHQRRSNPRYLHARQLIYKDKLLGRLTHVYGQWHRTRRDDLPYPEKWARSYKEDGWADWSKEKVQQARKDLVREFETVTLKKYGYDTPERFRNWRNYKEYAGGLIADLGSHQIDIFNWFLKSQPSTVMAMGGLDYYDKGQWYDNVMAMYTYPTGQGVVRGSYQVLTTSSFNGYYEAFSGDEGTLVISEDTKRGHVFREVVAKRKEWEDEAEKVEQMGKQAIELKIGESRAAEGKKAEAEALEAQSKKRIHQLHLENFFSAIRNGTPLSCPPEVGYETAVTVLKVNDALAAGKALSYKPGEFEV